MAQQRASQFHELANRMFAAASAHRVLPPVTPEGDVKWLVHEMNQCKPVHWRRLPKAECQYVDQAPEPHLRPALEVVEDQLILIATMSDPPATHDLRTEEAIRVLQALLLTSR